MILGDISRLHVRVDIDESEIVRLKTGGRAHASLRGQPQRSFPLTYVRLDPFVVPKTSLTGESQERVDVRVLQVIYALEETDCPIYVGQQLDVFIES
jgi:hypothetical protein